MLTEGSSSSGKALSNWSISSSPVTFTSVVFCTGMGAVSNASKENEPVASGEVIEAAATAGMGMSSSPSSEMSGKADAARSKSISSPPAAVAKEPPVSVGVENSSPRSSLSRERKSAIVVVVEEEEVVSEASKRLAGE